MNMNNLMQYYVLKEDVDSVKNKKLFRLKPKIPLGLEQVYIDQKYETKRFFRQYKHILA